MTGQSECAVRLRGVCKTYGKPPLAVKALIDADLDINKGEFLMLVGPSGSGKTTLLSILGCVLRPSVGEVSLFGTRIDGLEDKELPALRLSSVGFVFQQFNLLPSLSAAGNVEIPLLLQGTAKNEARARAIEALVDVGLSAKIHRKPKDLSGGEQQRVAIARAVAAKPPLILADEPTASLDGHRGHQVVEMLRDLAHKKGHTVVVVTHDSRVFHLADRLVHIEDGRLGPVPEDELPRSMR